MDNIERKTQNTQSNNVQEDSESKIKKNNNFPEKDVFEKKNDKDKDEIEVLKQKNKTLEEQNKELERKLMYVAAEYDNIKKRSVKELDDANKFAIAKFSTDLVKIYDVLITAIENTSKEKNEKMFYDGVKMTLSDFNSMFEKLQIKQISPEVGEKFDHNQHEAISRIPSDIEIGCIVKTVRVGYKLHERLLRPAMVVVSCGK